MYIDCAVNWRAAGILTNFESWRWLSRILSRCGPSACLIAEDIMTDVLPTGTPIIYYCLSFVPRPICALRVRGGSFAKASFVLHRWLFRSWGKGKIECAGYAFLHPYRSPRTLVGAYLHPTLPHPTPPTPRGSLCSEERPHQLFLLINRWWYNIYSPVWNNRTLNWHL